MPSITFKVGPVKDPSIVITDKIAEALDKAFRKAAPGIKERLGNVIVRRLQASPEYEAAIGGSLFHELGAIKSSVVLDRVLTNISNGVVVTNLGMRNVAGKLDGGLRIEILKGDYSEVLGVQGASFTSEGGYQIEWLRWLTLEGTRAIISDHHFQGGFESRSRTGYGIMAKGGTWAVPQEYAGTESSNWILRALVSLAEEASSIVVEEVGKGL